MVHNRARVSFGSNRLLPHFYLLLASAALAACDASADEANSPAPKSQAARPISLPAEPAPLRPSTAAVDAASEAIWDEPKVVDFNYRPNDVVQWIVAVEDDGTPRFGYAGYICLVLRQHGAFTPHSAVRVTDIAEQRVHGEDFRSASLGAMRCADEGELDDAPAVG